MLQKILIKTTCIKKGSVYANGGKEIHGWLFKGMEEIDSSLSKEIHCLEEKPFAIGPIFGCNKENGKSYLDEGKNYSFAIASLNKEMFCFLEEIICRLSKKMNLQLGNAVLEVNEIQPIFTEKGISYLGILEKSRPFSSFTLMFNSPTSFRSSGVQEVFPSSSLVFNNLLKRWNCFASFQCMEAIEYSKILISKYDLKTELLNYGQYKIIGFKGFCSYLLDQNISEEMKKMINALAFFSSIAGLGYKTSMGMGDIRYKNKRNPLTHERKV